MKKCGAFAQLGMIGKEVRAAYDLYCTNPKMVDLLLSKETFSSNVWECCNGLSHISKRLIEYGYSVRKSDIEPLVANCAEIDFLKNKEIFDGDIITNPPYTNAEQFVYKALESVNEGAKVAMLFKLNFLASEKRYKLFVSYPPRTIYILSKRYNCCKDGDFAKYNFNGAVDYCWIVWVKGWKGHTLCQWLTEETRAAS